MRAVIDGVYAAWADNDADEFVAGYAEAATATLPSGLGAPGDDPQAILKSAMPPTGGCSRYRTRSSHRPIRRRSLLHAMVR